MNPKMTERMEFGCVPLLGMYEVVETSVGLVDVVGGVLSVVFEVLRLKLLCVVIVEEELVVVTE